MEHLEIKPTFTMTDSREIEGASFLHNVPSTVAPIDAFKDACRGYLDAMINGNWMGLMVSPSSMRSLNPTCVADVKFEWELKNGAA